MASISNLFVDQGSDFNITVSLTDATDSALNLAGTSFLAQVRKSHGSNTVKATFTTSNDGVGGNLTLNHRCTNLCIRKWTICVRCRSNC